MSEDSPPTAFFRIGPERPSSPVILSVPHAGRHYSPELLKAARVPLGVLEALEDRLVDRLVWRATAAGATAFIARTPRAEIDLNRDEREIDPNMVTPILPPGSILASVRSRGGIGLIPSRIPGVGPIWRERVPRQELTRRIERIHRPYHEALERALEETRDRFGAAVLLDCHSMPPRGAGDSPVVFGDRYGTSSEPGLVQAAMNAARSLGYRPACNAPYAGGYVCGRHGRPDRSIHAIQLEIDRSAYLDSELRSPGPGFAGACALIAAVAAALEARLLGGEPALAAE
jgi:N-formylglutamate amidohydrolase